MTDEPRDPRSRTEVHRVADPEATRVATYLAQPGEVGRVLLLYSGGLDTSVMLKWIQDEYEAEVVALTVDLGQPGEDFDVVRGKALDLGALDCFVIDAREEFARGCTGKGNDQVRIESAVAALGPELKIIAPVRGWQMGREEEVEYARSHGIPVKGGTEVPPYSIDDNLWGRSSEGGPIEDLDEPPRDDVLQLVTAPEDAP